MNCRERELRRMKLSIPTLLTTSGMAIARRLVSFAGKRVTFANVPQETFGESEPRPALTEVLENNGQDQTPDCDLPSTSGEVRTTPNRVTTTLRSSSNRFVDELSSSLII